MTVNPSTPLSAIDAVVLDTETTGLDQRTARIVQVGAVRIIAGRLCEVDPLDVLVNPEVPIPPGSSDIHGITDAAVAAAPTFKDVAPQLGAYIDGAVVIGHTIGFDLGILAREHRSASLPFRMPHALDVRLLARLAVAFKGFEHPGSKLPLLWDMKRAASLADLVVHIEEPALRKMIGHTLDRFVAEVKPVLDTLRSQLEE